MLNKVENVINENESIIINTPDKAKFVNLLESLNSLNISFAHDLSNLLEVIKDIADNAEPENEQKSAYQFYRIGSIANVLLDKINPSQFDQLNYFLKSLKPTDHGTI